MKKKLLVTLLSLTFSSIVFADDETINKKKYSQKTKSISVYDRDEAQHENLLHLTKPANKNTNANRNLRIPDNDKVKLDRQMMLNGPQQNTQPRGIRF